MNIPRFLSGLFGFLILLQLCSCQGPPTIIDISDRDVKKDDMFLTVNCSLTKIPQGCKFLMYFNQTDLNQTQTDLHMKIDLFSNCSFTGAPCDFQCTTGEIIPLFFRRIAENVHPMKFNESYPYTVKVPESTGTNVVLYDLKPDMVSSADCYYSITDALVFAVKTHNDMFEVKPTGLHLKSRLDYEKTKEYNITVEAILYDKKTTTEFTVIVEDVDDMDPEFISGPYSLNITENKTSSLNNCLPTSPVIKAEDRDKGQGRQNLTYSITSGSNGVFIIENKTGCIFVTRLLSWEKNHLNMYHLSIKAEQDNDPGRYATSSVTVYVIDTNNHRPKFSTSYHAVIDEHARAGSYVTRVHAEDGDEGKFGEILYKLINSNGLFTIDNQTGVISVENSTGLDRETFPNITLEVQAIDVEANETGDTTSVDIDLNDINDHTPAFTQNYTFHIRSSDTVNVFAKDDDIGGNGRVTYALVTPNTGVNINENNGTISFTNIQVDELTFYVTACDNPDISNSQRCSFARVEAFLNGTISGAMTKNMSVAENSPVDTVVGSIDIHGATLSVMEQDVPFIIRADYLVRTTGILDRENTSTYTFTVTVTGKIISNITVNVAVLDVNDNPPVFIQADYVFGLPSGSSPLGNIQATDADLDENGNVSYSFQPSFTANKYFTIDSRSGEITRSGVEIPSYQSSFQLGVLASDNGVPQMKSFCSLYISRITLKGNYTVTIETPLKEEKLRNMLKDLEREISNILNLTVNAQVQTAINKRATTTQETRAVLEISATYRNGTRVPAKDLQREVLIHLSEIEALWTQDTNLKNPSTDDSNVSQIALIVVAGVMLLGTLIAVIVLSIKWRQFKAHEKVHRLNETLTRRSSLYESQEIKVRMDDETSDYNGSLNTQDLETYENGHRPVGDLIAFQNPVYNGDDTDETKVKAQAINEALLSLKDLSNRLEEEDPLAPKPDYEITGQSEPQDASSLDQNEASGLSDKLVNDDLNAYDSVETVKNTNTNPYENIDFDDDFPSTSGFAGLKIDGKMITSTGEGHEEDIFIGDDDDTGSANMAQENDSIPEDEPDVDYHLKQVRFANRVVNADTNVAEELKPDQSEIVKETDKKIPSRDDDVDNDDTDDDKAFPIKADSNNEYDNEADFSVDNADTSIRMDEEINSPVDFLKSDDSNAETAEDTGTFVFCEEEITSL